MAALILCGKWSGTDFDRHRLVLAAAAVLAGAAGHRQDGRVFEGIRALDGATGGAAVVPGNDAQHIGTRAVDNLLERPRTHRVGEQIGPAIRAFFNVIGGFGQAVGTLAHKR